MGHLSHPGSDPTTTLTLLQRAQSGDKEALSQLFLRHHTRVNAMVWMLMGPQLKQRTELDDLVQSVYERALASVQAFEWRGEGSFFRWLEGIARHLVLQQVRKPHLPPIGGGPGDDGIPTGAKPRSNGAESSPALSLERQERFERLRTALGQLDKDYQEVIYLARIARYKIKDIAARMGRTEGAIHMLLRRALHDLKLHYGSTASFELPPGQSLAPLSGGDGQPASPEGG